MSVHLELLAENVTARRAVIGVIGLGYVGLPVASLFAEAGFDVVGVDVKQERVDLVQAGINPIEGEEPGLEDLLKSVVASGTLRATSDYAALSGADVVTINVDTPVDDVSHQPRYEALRSACQRLGAILKPGALVIVESTIAPGTMERIVQPILEATTGWVAGREFFLGHCPERVMPGKLLANLRQLSRVVGAQTPGVANIMISLYGTIVNGDLDATDLLTAELVKTTENAYRDVNIAFANQVALICQAIGGDVWKVRELVNKSPGRQMLLPGAGVGGHCIPKDPWLLAASVDEPSPLISMARTVNDGMPGEVVKLTLNCLVERGVNTREARIAVLGLAYLEDSDDFRNSPTEELVRQLEELGCEVRVHDPYVSDYGGELLPVVEGADCVVVMVAHSPYRTIDLESIGAVLRQRALVDARHVFQPEQLVDAGFIFRTIGIGHRAAAPQAAVTRTERKREVS